MLDVSVGGILDAFPPMGDKDSALSRPTHLQTSSRSPSFHYITVLARLLFRVHIIVTWYMFFRAELLFDLFF